MNRAGRALLAAILCTAAATHAEPYLAVLNHATCASCHFNPTGGGLRHSAGNLYAQYSLPARPIDRLPEWLAAGSDTGSNTGSDTGTEKVWDGSLHPRVRIGGDLRAALASTGVDDEDTRLAFDFEEALLYLQLDLLAQRLSIYLDERVAPGGALNREAYLLFSDPAQRFYLKAGRLFLPYGWRIEDDAAFIRQVPGINYTTPDDGVEVGLNLGRWQLQSALTNGNAGGAEDNIGKQWSLRAEYLAGRWRAGASANDNNGVSDTSRRMGNLFAGLAIGPTAWLAEVDYVRDERGTGRREQLIGYLEASWRYAAGQYLRLALEGLDPDRDVDEDRRNRATLSFEIFPLPFTQLRLGVSRYEGIPQNEQQNRREGFIELHALF